MGKKAEVKEQGIKNIVNELAEAAGTGIGTAKKEFNKSVKSFNKWLDDTLTPGSLTTKQKQQAKNLNQKINKEKDPLKSFADSKNKAVQKARTEAADKAKAIADKKKADLKRRQAAERQKAIDANKAKIKKAGKVAGGTTVIGAGGKALYDRGADDDKPKAPKGGAGGRAGFKSGMTGNGNKSNRSNINLKIDLTKGPGLKAGEVRAPTFKRDKKADEAFKAARKAARGTVTGKDGRNVGVGENKRANVTREQLKDSGMNLNQYLNFMDKNDGKRPPKVANKNMGGMMRKSSVPGYKDGKEVKKQGANDRLDESLGSRNGSKTQSMKARRDESKGMEKSMGRRAYSGNRSSGQTKSTKPSRPQSAGVAKRGWGAAIR